MLTFSHQTQLAEIGFGLATSFAGMAMSAAFAATAVAFTLPLAFASLAPMRTPTGAAAPLPTPAAAAVEPYSSYRSDGGHATTLVLMLPMPAGA